MYSLARNAAELTWDILERRETFVYHLYQRGAFVLVVQTDQEKEEVDAVLEKFRDEPWRSIFVVELEA